MNDKTRDDVALVTVKAAAEMLAMSDSYVQKLCDRRLVRVVRFGRAVRLVKEDVVRLAQEGVSS